jgi:hypothetical protein
VRRAAWILTIALICSGRAPGHAADVADTASSQLSCDYSIVAPGDDGVAVLQGRCDDPAAGLGSAIGNELSGIDRASQLALGRTRFEDGGVFEQCALLGRLADDPRWVSDINSLEAQTVLADALSALGPVESVQTALHSRGKKVIQVDAEMVLLHQVPVSECAKQPPTIPTEALIWLAFE